MHIIWGSLAGIMLYLELIYHLSGYGWSRCMPIYTIALIIAWSSVQTILVGMVNQRLKKICYYGFIWFDVIWCCVQLVYLRIFKQPLLWEAIFRGGGDALTNYWREALAGVLSAISFLLLFILPAVVIGIVMHKKKWIFPQFTSLQLMRTAVILVIGIMGSILTMEVGRIIDADYYEDYKEFYDPLSVAQSMGVFPMLQRDTVLSVIHMAEDMWGYDAAEVEPFVAKDSIAESKVDEKAAFDAEKDATESTNSGMEKDAVEDVDTDATEAGNDSVAETEQSQKVEPEAGKELLQEAAEKRQWQQFNLDFDTLYALADNDKEIWLTDYIQQEAPTNTNEYTGMFEGYNLIYLTAEGFCPYAIREDLTPTLYRLTHSGFVFENYYVPLWQTSTSDGEYINCTGLIPDGQFSMRKSSENTMAFTLPKFFAEEGVYSYSYHNNTLSYYDRYLTHPNMGYDFKGCKLGILSAEEWGSQVFPMDNPDAWPASDLEMMQGTVPEYVNKERFHVYYLTVSGHMNYNFKGNAMSHKNREAVAHLDMSENARAYIACNMELDKALEYLITQLETAGQLEKTVICLSADHYPYAMSTEQYEELAGKPLDEAMDMFRNCMILWNAGMKEPVYVEKACGSMDILPTLLNLFGFAYDSRMYAGRDIFSDQEGLVIFNDRSFVTDSVIYNRKEKETIWLKDAEGNDLIPAEQQDAYFAERKQEVKNRYQFSAYILQEDYYRNVEQALLTETAQ